MRFLLPVLLVLITVLRTTSQNAIESYIIAAVEATENRQYEKAIDICNQMVLIEPENANHYYLRGVNKSFLEDYDGAIRDFNVTLKLNPNYTDAYLKRAKAKNKKGNLIGALMDLNSAKNENLYQTLTTVTGEFIRSIFSVKKDE